jgi:hypothetical protein
MTPKSQNIGIRKALQRPLFCDGLLACFFDNKFRHNCKGTDGGGISKFISLEVM